LAPRGFQGGLKGREFFDNLTDEQQQLARVYASALLDDGVATEDELPEGQLEEARKLHGQVEAKGAYRLETRLPTIGATLNWSRTCPPRKRVWRKRKAGCKARPRRRWLKNSTRVLRNAPPSRPCSGSLEPEMKKYLDGFTAAQAADAKTDPESYLRSKMTDREAKGFSAASAMAASGMRATEIMDNLQALSPLKSVVRSWVPWLLAMPSLRPRCGSHPVRPCLRLRRSRTEDRRAQEEAELARALTSPWLAAPASASLTTVSQVLSPVKKRRHKSDGFGGIVSVLSVTDSWTRAWRATTPLPNFLNPPLLPLIPTGSMTAGDEDRVQRARYEADLAADKAERARRAFGEIEDPRDAAAVRGALMQGLEPARSVEPTRADLRPEPFILDSTRKINSDEQAPAPDPAPDPFVRLPGESDADYAKRLREMD
jgi:hypothetical protein